MWDLRVNKIVYTFWEHINAHSYASSIIDKSNLLLAAGKYWVWFSTRKIFYSISW